MDYLKRMNNALDYIESNLDGEIDYNIVAKLACCSITCFQRMFSLIADIHISEYIRRRRMTLAAFELQNRNAKVKERQLKQEFRMDISEILPI
jgi:AraC family transcriptional regulator